MKVSKLIEELQKMDPNSEALIMRRPDYGQELLHVIRLCQRDPAICLLMVNVDSEYEGVR